MKNSNIQLGFSIQGIKTEQFAVIEDNYNPKKETGLSTELQFKLDNENRQAGIFITFEFLQGKKVFIKLEVSCHFRIEEESWQSFKSENGTSITIPKGFLAHLAMITTGTSRGILFSKTEGSPFSKFIIPTLNVAEMITEDASFEIATV